MKISRLIPFFVIAALVTSCRQKSEIITEAEVIAVINKFDDAWENKNAAVVDSVLSSHYLYFTQSGGTFDRKSILKTASSSVYKLQTMQRSKFSIIIEGNTAVVNSIWYGKGSYHGEDFDDSQRCSITLIKLKGKVKILSEHCTPIKTP
ncbi:MAG: nuclear transport factor 2 family protein [Chitinophagaceae bacterium]|nr:nuclear transport factor 2 family protein [Chitinophagaceae bacterium]MBK8952196.1 nuclear transport factor 2 family protein [Chitinophagaceae bacterium]